jgi:VanZ family protein
MQPATADRRPTRAALRRWLPWLAAFLLVLIPFFVPIPRELQRHPVIGGLGDRLHIPLLFLATLLLHARGPLAGRIWAAAVAAMVLGGVIEFVQAFVGRSPLLDDWLLDLVGIGLAVCWLEWRRRRARWAVAGAIALLALIVMQLAYMPSLIAARRAAYARFPLLEDFSHHHADRLWKAQGNAVLSFRDLGIPYGRVLEIGVAPPATYPGAILHYFPPDWSGFRYLIFRARTTEPAGADVELDVRLDDYLSRHDPAWLLTRFQVGPGWHTYVVDLADLHDPQRIHGDRLLAVDDMKSILFYVWRPSVATSVQIDDIRLTRVELDGSPREP